MNRIGNCLKTVTPNIVLKAVRKLRNRRVSKKLYSSFLLLRKNKAYNYEPSQIGGMFFDSKRDWEQRWTLIRAELESYKAGSILDIGCAEGWFLRLAAQELGCVSLGVEIDNNRLLLGEIARLHDKIERCTIMKWKLRSNDFSKLPRFDIVLCLSVVHHIIRKEGMEAAKEFLRAINSRTKKALIFEMGTSLEKKMSWANKMPAMEKGQSKFIVDMLASAGFTKIRKLGNIASIEKDAKRLLFIAEPLG